MRFPALFILAAMWVGCPGEDVAAKRAEERLKRSQAEKAEKKKKSAELDAERQKARKGEPSLGAPWDDAKIIVPDHPCPVGTWAFFSGPAPGADADEKKENEANRESLLADLKAEVFMVKVRDPVISVKPFDAASGSLPLEVKGGIECTDGGGRISIAWTAPKPVTLPVPLASAAAAKEWTEKNGPALLARVAFKLSRGEAEGRVVRAELLGVRVSAGQDPAALAEKKAGF